MIKQWILIIIGLVAIYCFCPRFRAGLGSSNLKEGIEKNWKLGIVVVLWSFASVFTGVVGKLDNQPTFSKIFIKGFFYYISAAIIEELYVKGLLLNILSDFDIYYII